MISRTSLQMRKRVPDMNQLRKISTPLKSKDRLTHSSQILSLTQQASKHHFTSETDIRTSEFRNTSTTFIHKQMIIIDYLVILS